jgi:hypothetical protein
MSAVAKMNANKKKNHNAAEPGMAQGEEGANQK